MVIFVDTSALLALIDINDQFYSQAMSTWQKLLDSNDSLVTNNYVLVESISLAQRRIGMDAVQILQSEIAPFMDVEWFDADLHQSAMQRVLATNRRSLSLVDCSSFETMKRLGLKTVFTFDEHFRGQGFEVIP